VAAGLAIFLLLNKNVFMGQARLHDYGILGLNFVGRRWNAGGSLRNLYQHRGYRRMRTRGNSSPQRDPRQNPRIIIVLAAMGIMSVSGSPIIDPQTKSNIRSRILILMSAFLVALLCRPLFSLDGGLRVNGCTTIVEALSPIFF